jgi:uncharacterized membrane protein YhaH (DUF805 family)
MSYDLSGRPVEIPAPATTPPLAPGQVNPGFGVVGLPGEDAFGQTPGQPTAGVAGYATGYPAQSGAAWGGAGYGAIPSYAMGVSGDYRFVGPIRALGLGFRKYARFTGRSSRSEFWWWFLFWYLTMLTLAVLFTLYYSRLIRVTCYGQTLSDCHANLTPLWVGSGIFLVFLFGTLVPSVAIVCRRLQDSDRSGNWVWLYFATLFINLVPFIGQIISLGINILLLVWLAWPGTMGPNRYGDMPAEGRR